MNCFTTSSLLVILLVTFSSTTEGRNNRVTIIRMRTTTTTYTSTTTTGTVCLKVTSKPGDPPVTQCRKRRQFWIEDPVFFSPLDGQPLSQFYIQPTEIFRVEPTALPVAGFKTSNHQHPRFNSVGYDSSGSLINLGPSQSLQSSFLLPESNDYDDYGYQRRIYLPHSPLILRRVWDYVSNDMYRWFGTSTSTTRRTKSTVYFTRTKTITENEMSTKTNTIAIYGCTPSPLPFDLCVP